MKKLLYLGLSAGALALTSCATCAPLTPADYKLHASVEHDPRTRLEEPKPSRIR